MLVLCQFTCKKKLEGQVVHSVKSVVAGGHNYTLQKPLFGFSGSSDN